MSVYFEELLPKTIFLDYKVMHQRLAQYVNKRHVDHMFC